jgi:hypothetical protein
LSDLQAFARRRALQIGLVEPNDEEKQAQEEAEQNAQPDATQAVLAAQAKALEAGAVKDEAMAGKYVADTGLSEAKRIETLTKAHANVNTDGPVIRMGRDMP